MVFEIPGLIIPKISAVYKSGSDGCFFFFRLFFFFLPFSMPCDFSLEARQDVLSERNGGK